MRVNATSSLARWLLVLLVVSGLVGCSVNWSALRRNAARSANQLTRFWTERGPRGVGLLPKAAPGEKNFSQYQPRQPYSQLNPGIMTRTLFEVATSNGYRVEVRDVLVGPRQRTERVSLPGAAVFEIRSGGGILTVNGKRQELSPGSTLSLSEGQAFSIENNSDAPITIRVYLIIAQ